MRVLFISWRDQAHPQAGGSEVVVDRLALGLIQRGHEAALVCGGPVAPRPYPVVRAGGTYSQYLRAPLHCLRSFRDWDLFVDVANGVPFFSPLWRRRPRLCLVHHVHGDQWRQYFPRPLAAAGMFTEQALVPLVYRNTDFIAISESTRTELKRLGVDGSRVHVVLGGVDPDLFEPPQPKSEQPLFLVLGRAAPNKRLGLLLDMWTEVRSTTGGCLVIAGDGPDLPGLRARGLPGVQFLGRVSPERKRELLSSAWLLVHPAEREGWGLVIMEAAAVGTPALGFAVPGVQDAIVDGVTGMIAGSSADFCAKWIELASDMDHRYALGAAARERAKNFGWNATIDAFLEAATEVTRGRF